MQTLKKLLYFLSPQEQKHAGLLLLMILIMALIDVLGIASIMPFMAVITNPSLIQTNYILNTMFQASSVIGVKTNQEFIFMFGFLVFIFLIFSISFKALTVYIQLRFIQMREYSISKRLLETYLHQPYSWFLNQNSANIGKSILSETGIFLGQSLGPMLTLLTQSTITIIIFTLLLLIDLKLTVLIAFIFIGTYVLIYNLFRRYLSRKGKERLIANEFRFKSISEAFGASKEVKLGGLEKIFINRYSKPAKIYAKNQASSQIIGLLPRYFIEATTFGGMLLLTLYIISTTGDFVNSIPIISVYAFAGYRLLPSIQQIYQSSTALKFSNSVIDKLYNDLKELKINIGNENKDILSFNKSITLNHIHYDYPNSSRTALKDINMIIPAKTTVGLIGTTGCGKTTTVDIILGLLSAQKGTLEVDDKVITKKNTRAWQQSIGYVPQQIYLSDDTIANNIAFGIDPKDISQQSIERAAKLANLHDFVINELQNQYQTVVGERGIRLSGGQRQRIGIARALYHKPKVIILDEATSALDIKTEEVVMSAINKLSKNITVILIAHRLDTVKNCDIIFKLDKGQLIAQGTFDELINGAKI